MAERIVVTSLGILSALGNGIAANLQALQQQRPGLRYPQLLQTIHAGEFLLGEVPYSNDELSAMLGLPTGNNGYTRTTLLAMVAMQEVLKGIDKKELQDEGFAFINANTVGGMCSVEDMYEDFLSDNTAENALKYIDTLDCAESTQNVTKHFGLKPFTATISTACSSSGNAIILGARLIQHGIIKRAICGGCDALSRFTLNGFHSLKNVDKQPARPFDNTRFGLNLGEGAGYVLLETEKSAKERGAEIIAVLSGYANTNDAYHPTAPNPNGDGAYNTMQLALQKAQLQTTDINYINAHGTATTANDAAEGKAIERLFNGHTPHFSSTKPYTGHTLAAAGVIEAIFSIGALQQQMIWPSLNHTTQMEEVSITPTTQLIEDAGINHVLSNSFGFGGNNVSLIFSRA
ncbi:MAG TPA: beta-ketoacyl-[acyl-carrier-protein] synthase family protein [Flavipsychrobacter sp.]